MEYQFSFRQFSQKFTHAVITNHGVWDMREGIIIKLVDRTGKVGWGEISPIAWFGSETLEQAREFCSQLPEIITPEMILDIPAHLPACQFAFESARENFSNSMPVFKNQHLRDKSLTSKKMKYSALLPRGEAAVQGWKNLWQKGYETFKLKIAVDNITQELEILHLLVRQLPESAKIRLDANGGLNYQQAKLWLEVCDQFSQKIEFIEQPLGIDRLEEMLELSQVYLTEIALDESVATWQKLESCYQMGWRGVFVVKPAILGSPSRLRGFCQNHTIDLVFSSVFETPIGREAALQLAGELSHGISNLSGNCRSLGFGIDHYFALQSTNWPEVLWNPIY